MEGAIGLPRVPPANVPTPIDTSYDWLFLSDGSSSTTDGGLYRKAFGGTITAVIPVAYTDAAAVAAVYAAITSTGSSIVKSTVAGSINLEIAPEYLRDFINAYVLANVDGTIVITPSDAGDSFDIQVGTITSAKVSDFATAAANAIFVTSLSTFVEAAQDAVLASGVIADTSEVDFTYNDGSNTWSFVMVTGGLALTKIATIGGGLILGNPFGASAASPSALTRAQSEQIVKGGIAARNNTGADFAIASNANHQVLPSFILPAGSPAVDDAYLLIYECVATITATLVTPTVRGRLGTSAAHAGASDHVYAIDVNTTVATAKTAVSMRIMSLVRFLTVGATGTVSGGIELDGTLFRAGTYVAPAALPAAVSVDTTQAITLGCTYQASVAGITASVKSAAIFKV